MIEPYMLRLLPVPPKEARKSVRRLSRSSSMASTSSTFSNSSSSSPFSFSSSSSWPSSWKEILQSLELLYPNEKVKLILLLRHAEAYHNEIRAKYGDDAWYDHYAKLPEYLDCALDKHGITQAQEAKMILEEEIQKHGLNIEKVILSPLTRVLQTYELVYEKYRHVPTECTELCRERIGVFPCDQRQCLTELKTKFQWINTSLIPTNGDTLHSSQTRETIEEVEQRAKRFLHYIMSDLEDTSIGVISHSRFISCFLDILQCPKTKLKNAEFFPIVIRAKTIKTENNNEEVIFHFCNIE